MLSLSCQISLFSDMQVLKCSFCARGSQSQKSCGRSWSLEQSFCLRWEMTSCQLKGFLHELQAPQSLQGMRHKLTASWTACRQQVSRGWRARYRMPTLWALK